MRVSLNIIEKLVGFELLEVHELVKKVNSQLGGVEEIINLGEKYKDVKIVKVVESEKHPNADKLSVCKIDAGTGEDIQVVCGAPNVHSDMWAIWLPPKSIVPSTFEDDEPFVLSARELRGVMSNGMLAASDELGFDNNHEVIIEITEGDLLPGVTLEPGMSFSEAFGLDGYAIDIENKMFTHRPDLFGQLGVAREIAGIFGKKFESPEWYLNVPKFDSASELELTVTNEAPGKAPRLMAVAMSGVEIKPSPLWLQCQLVSLGSKPINNVVDATNYIMLMTAQPTHAYDYDKLRGHKVGVRLAKKGEKIRLLNDKTYELSEDDIVIIDGEGPIGLAGVMGGFDSEVTNDTKNIVLEVANFDMYTVRKTSMRYGLFTDALTRFNKGQSPLQNSRIMLELMDTMTSLAGAKQASNVYDEMGTKVSDALEADELYPPLTIKPSFIRERLGLDISKHDMVNLLTNVEFPPCEDCGWDPSDEVDNQDDLHVNVPFWRTDIELAEDVVEEIGRLYGFDKLPRELPLRSTKPAPKNAVREAKQKVRDSFVKSGANEVLTYSFVHENVIKNAEQDIEQAFVLGNAMSPDLQYYRLSVLPSLLDKVHMNIKAGHDEFALFEIGKGHNKKYHLDDADGLPGEMNFVDLVYASKKNREGAPYFMVRRMLQQLGLDLGFTLKFKPVTESLDYPVTAPFDQERSSLVETQDGIFIGMIGELKQSVRKNFKLPDYISAMTLDMQGIQKASESPSRVYSALSKYPSVTQDISLKVPTSVAYQDLFTEVYQQASADGNLDVNLSPITIYQSADDDSSKTITFRIKLTNHEKTLSDSDVAPIIKRISDSVGKKFKASVV